MGSPAPVLSLLAYTSTPVQALSKQEIFEILARARVKNARLGISGMLLVIDGSFFQILEGDPVVVSKLLNTIAADPRHGSVLKLIEEPIEKRVFSDWSMAHADVTRAELRAIDGLNDFFTHSSNLDGLESGRAKTMLAAFRDGRWRRRLA